MKLSPLSLVLLLSLPTGSHGFLNFILQLIFGPLINQACNSALGNIFNGSTEITCGGCSVNIGTFFSIGGTIVCSTDSNGINYPSDADPQVNVKGSVTINVAAGSLFNPTPEIQTANGCLEVDPTNLITNSNIPNEANLLAAIQTQKPQVCATVQGSGFGFTGCSVQLKFGSRTAACQTCNACGGTPGQQTGFDLDCSNIDLHDFILDTTDATNNLNLPDFPCIGF